MTRSYYSSISRLESSLRIILDKSAEISLNLTVPAVAVLNKLLTNNLFSLSEDGEYIFEDDDYCCCFSF